MPELVATRAVKTLNDVLTGSAVVLLLAVGSAPFVASTLVPGQVAVAAPASPTALPSSAADGAATRVAIPALGVDLPVVSSAVTLEGNEPGYPLCDVAQYSDRFEDPGRPGTTYIYAHARPNMLLPLLEASRVDDGRSLLGMEVLVFTNDSRLHTYRIFIVKRHATDFSLADQAPPDESRLVLQTSEGPRGTIPVLQVAAKLASTVAANVEDAHPIARPTVCQYRVEPLVSKRVLAAAAVGVAALLAVAWWLRNRRRLKGRDARA